MKRTALFATAAICAVALPLFAAEYAADADPRIESLAGGKITFAYNDGGAITNLTMTPAPGETLTLSGDEHRIQHCRGNAASQQVRSDDR